MEPCTFRSRPQKCFPQTFLMFFLKKPSLKKFLYFIKKNPTFLETEIPKKSLYFRKWNFLVLQETELSYISGKVYSEP